MAVEQFDTPPPVASPPSAPSALPRSGLDSLLSKLPGTAVQAYALHLLQPVLSEAMRTSCSEDRWKWALLGFDFVVFPIFVLSGFDLARQFLSRRSSPP